MLWLNSVDYMLLLHQTLTTTNSAQTYHCRIGRDQACCGMSLGSVVLWEHACLESLSEWWATLSSQNSCGRFEDETRELRCHLLSTGTRFEGSVPPQMWKWDSGSWRGLFLPLWAYTFHPHKMEILDLSHRCKYKQIYLCYHSRRWAPSSVKECAAIIIRHSLTPSMERWLYDPRKNVFFFGSTMSSCDGVGTST